MTIPTFPTLSGLEYPVKRSPLWSSIPQQAISGVKTVLQLFTYPLYKWSLSFSYLGSAGSNTDWQTLLGFFNSVAGTALPFHFNDPDDNSVANQSLGVGNGTQTQFIFVRALGGFVEPIQDVTQASVTVYNAGTPTVAFTYLTDPNWGFTYGVQFTVAPVAGHAITATFNYNWPCRFSADSLDFENFLFRFWNLKKVELEGMKVI